MLSIPAYSKTHNYVYSTFVTKFGQFFISMSLLRSKDLKFYINIIAYKNDMFLVKLLWLAKSHAYINQIFVEARFSQICHN